MCGIAPGAGLSLPAADRDHPPGKWEDYCRQQGLDYVTDSTNADPHYTRNRLRLEVVPQLYVINPALPEAFSRLIEAMEEGYALVGAETGRFLAEHGTDGRVDTAAFLAAPGGGPAGGAGTAGRKMGGRALPPGTPNSAGSWPPVPVQWRSAAGSAF